MSNGVVKDWPLALLRLEGATLFCCGVWAYQRSGRSWWTFATALLLPDLAMSGYFVNNQLGAATYNLLHTETPALALLAAGAAFNNSQAYAASLIWLVHIGMDRMLGFGLKYGQFGHTHLGLIGH